MRESDRLGRLQVGVSRHQHVHVPTRHLRPRLQERRHVLQYVPLGLDGPKPSVRRHLIVAGSARVQFASHRTDEFGETTFVGGVYVLVSRFDDEGPSLPLLFDLTQALDEDVAFGFGDDADLGGGFGVGDGAAEVLGPHPLVEPYALVELLHDRIGTALEPSPGTEKSAPGSFALIGRRHGLFLFFSKARSDRVLRRIFSRFVSSRRVASSICRLRSKGGRAPDLFDYSLLFAGLGKEGRLGAKLGCSQTSLGN
mmetsp:Transcript_24765/g.50259  ORF Transcript_24765/g.50259 Transcript_24765/m.50259 type:complete len:254 (-) Transcript_24765:27-788(-)